MFGLVYRLRMAVMKYGLILHMVHIAGTRMIDVGVDGLSQGQLSEGVMAGDSILKHVPLHLSACTRSGDVMSWL